MAPIEVERTLVKSPPELWEEIGTADALGRWLGDVRVESAEPPGRVEWARSDSAGVIELEASGWGTRVRVVAKAKGVPWERGHAKRDVESALAELLDALGASSLQAG
jgi:hypothetical protein